jgi:hypothetical protein
MQLSAAEWGSKYDKSEYSCFRVLVQLCWADKMVPVEEARSLRILPTTRTAGNFRPIFVWQGAS